MDLGTNKAAATVDPPATTYTRFDSALRDAGNRPIKRLPDTFSALANYTFTTQQVAPPQS